MKKLTIAILLAVIFSAVPVKAKAFDFGYLSPAYTAYKVYTNAKDAGVDLGYMSPAYTAYKLYKRANGSDKKETNTNTGSKSGLPSSSSGSPKSATSSTSSIADPNMPNTNEIVLPPSRFTNLTELISGAIQWLLTFAGILAVLAIVYSGIMYITSAGEPDKAEAAKKNLTWAIIGILVILLANVIIATVKQILTSNPS